jgi:hypothetical protein
MGGCRGQREPLYPGWEGGTGEGDGLWGEAECGGGVRVFRGLTEGQSFFSVLE